MKKLMVALCVTFALAIASHAQEAGKGKKAEHAKPTAEQKALKKEMLEKYDTNKDGKLDKGERAKMSKEDKTKLREARKANAKKPE